MKYFKLILALLIPQLIGILGSLFTAPNLTWLSTLNKPSFYPPNYLFSPVWITLFLLMGISLYLILEKKKNKLALTFFSIQLTLNLLWSVLFFGLHSPLLAFIEIIMLWLFILLTIIYSYRISKASAYLLIPYILWVTFAAILNLAFVS